jgi:hypothetical protein
MGLLDNINFQQKKGEGSYLQQQYPEILGALKGLMGTAPDEVGGSVLDQFHQQVKDGADVGYATNLVSGLFPFAATKALGFSKIPSMLNEISQIYQDTGQIKKLSKIPAVVLSKAEQDAFNAARVGKEPRLTSPVLDYRGNHHFNSRGPTEYGNNYTNEDLLQQLDAISGQNLFLRNDRVGPALQTIGKRVDNYGKTVRDKAVIAVDQNGKGELFSIIPEGDGLRKGEKVQSTPR